MKHHAYDFVPGLVLVAALAAPTGASAGMMGAEPEASAASSRSVATFRTAMRKLWEEHIEYTRNYIISGLAGLEDASAAAERLLRNQDDIGDAIKPFYGEAAGKKLSALLRDHIVIAADIVSAARSGNSSGVSQGEKK
jgi:hypothetical protein